MAVLVLQALAVEGGAPGGAAQQEAARLAVAGGPPEVPGALEAEHGVVDKERNQREVVHAVTGGGGHPAGHGAGFVDALLHDAAFLVFAVIHHLAGVLGLVALALGRINTELAEHALHAEGARLVGDDGHHPIADALVLHQGAEHAHERHGGGNLPVAAAFQEGFEELQLGNGQLVAGVAAAHRHIAAQLFALLAHVAQLRGVLVRPVIGHGFQFFVGERHVEAVAEFLQAFQIHLLHLVGLVDRLAGAGGVALHGFRQDHRGLAGVVHRLVVGRVHLERVMAAAIETINVLVAHVLDHFLQLRVFAEEMLAGVGAAVFLVGLVFAVHRFVHAAAQQAFGILLQQRVPEPAPDHFDHVPAGAAEQAFQLLDDLAVAAHRPVQALQVAVDHEDQIIQLLAAGHGQRAQGFRLVHLAVAEEGPHLALAVRNQLPVLQVLHDVRLVDRLHGAQAHGHGGELPVIRHQPGVRIGRQPLAVHFPAEVVHLLFSDAPLQVGTGVNARRRMALEIHQVAGVVLVGGFEEVVEADVVERGGRREGGDVAAQFVVVILVGPDHHRQRVPAHQGTDASFHVDVAGDRGFVLGADGVEVRGVEVGADNALFLGFIGEGFQQPAGAFGPLLFQHRFQCLEPFPGFFRVHVFKEVSIVHGRASFFAVPGRRGIAATAG